MAIAAMNWVRSGLESISGLLVGPAGDDVQASVIRLEGVRRAMLDALGDHGRGRFLQLSTRIRFALDAQALWYLRSDLLVALAKTEGESRAQVMMLVINAQFDGLLPEALYARPFRGATAIHL